MRSSTSSRFKRGSSRKAGSVILVPWIHSVQITVAAGEAPQNTRDGHALDRIFGEVRVDDLREARLGFVVELSLERAAHLLVDRAHADLREEEVEERKDKARHAHVGAELELDVGVTNFQCDVLA